MNRFTFLNVKSVLVSAIIFVGFSFPVFAETYSWAYTSAKPIEKNIISAREIADGATSAKYYFVNSTGWGHPDCPTAKHAYISSSAVGAKEFLGVLLTAQATGVNVKFLGDCVDSSSDYLIFEYVEIQ